jgi:hypothetical protein
MPARYQKQHKEDACFLTESSLLVEFSQSILSRSSPVKVSQVACEFDYSSGRTDLVAKDRNLELYAFELKLNDWRKALQQARRSECFAHYTFVVLPYRNSRAALESESLFRQAGVGLILLDGVSAYLVFPARRKNPLLPWLTEKASTFISHEQSHSA